MRDSSLRQHDVTVANDTGFTVRDKSDCSKTGVDPLKTCAKSIARGSTPEMRLEFQFERGSTPD